MTFHNKTRDKRIFKKSPLLIFSIFIFSDEPELEISDEIERTASNETEQAHRDLEEDGEPEEDADFDMENENETIYSDEDDHSLDSFSSGESNLNYYFLNMIRKNYQIC